MNSMPNHPRESRSSRAAVTQPQTPGSNPFRLFCNLPADLRQEIAADFDETEFTGGAQTLFDYTDQTGADLFG